MVERKGRWGRTFYGCSRYPECRSPRYHRPVAETLPGLRAALPPREGDEEGRPARLLRQRGLHRTTGRADGRARLYSTGAHEPARDGRRRRPRRLRGGLAARPPRRRPSICYEMRPVRQTPVHQTGDLAELVCSNSLRGNALDQAAGLLKEEMRRLGLARHAGGRRRSGSRPAARSPSTAALFARRITEAVESLPGVAHPPRGGASHPRRTRSRSWPPARSPRTAWPQDVAAFVGRGAPLLLRRGEPGRRGRHDRPRPGLPGLALRQGRRRLPQLPARARREYRAFFEALHAAESASVHDFEKELVLRGLPARSR